MMKICVKVNIWVGFPISPTTQHNQTKGGTKHVFTEILAQIHIDLMSHGSNYFHDGMCRNGDLSDCSWKYKSSYVKGQQKKAE